MDKENVVRKYLGTKHGEGVSGCFLFVKDFYRDEFGVIIKKDYLEMLNDFRVVSEPSFGDVVLIRNHPIVVNHVGVYLSNKEFLHGGALGKKDEVVLSRLDNSHIKHRVVGFLRYKEFGND